MNKNYNEFLGIEIELNDPITIKEDNMFSIQDQNKYVFKIMKYNKETKELKPFENLLLTNKEIERKIKEIKKDNSLVPLRSYNPSNSTINRDENITDVKTLYFDFDKVTYEDTLPKLISFLKKYNLDENIASFKKSCSGNIHMIINCDYNLRFDAERLNNIQSIHRKMHTALELEGLKPDRSLAGYLNHLIYCEEIPIARKNNNISTFTKRATNSIHYNYLFEIFKSFKERNEDIDNKKTIILKEKAKNNNSYSVNMNTGLEDKNDFNILNLKKESFFLHIDNLIIKYPQERIKSVVCPVLYMAFYEGWANEARRYMIEKMPDKQSDINYCFLRISRESPRWREYEWEYIEKKKIKSYNKVAYKILNYLKENKQFTYRELLKEFNLAMGSLQEILKIAETKGLIKIKKGDHKIRYSVVIQNNFIKKKMNEKSNEYKLAFNSIHRILFKLRMFSIQISRSYYNIPLTYKEIIDNKIYNIHTLERYLFKIEKLKIGVKELYSSKFRFSILSKFTLPAFCT